MDAFVQPAVCNMKLISTPLLAAAEVEANVETGIESLLKDLEDSPIEGGNLEPSNAEEDFLDRTSGTNSPLAPYPSSTPATTPSNKAPTLISLRG